MKTMRFERDGRIFFIEEATTSDRQIDKKNHTEEREKKKRQTGCEFVV